MRLRNDRYEEALTRPAQSSYPTTSQEQAKMDQRSYNATASSVPARPPQPKPSATIAPASYTTPFMDFLTQNPTVFHAVAHFSKKLEDNGFTKLSERELWTGGKLKKGGKYLVERNGSSLIAFVVGGEYKPGNGAAIIAGHIDALTARLKPIPKLQTKAGFVQLGVGPYAGGLNNTWFDRDLGIGGRVLVRDEKSGKIVTKLVKLGWPIARIPTLAPHFGIPTSGPFNKETQLVPIIGLDNSDLSSSSSEQENSWKAGILGGEGTFAATQPERLVKAIAKELEIDDVSTIVNWELELFDTQPAQVGGLDKEFIFAGRIDDKLCSYAAFEALLLSTSSSSSPYSYGGGPDESGVIKVLGLFDDEEIGSELRQGAFGNFLPSVLERALEGLAGPETFGSNLISQAYANSFLVSADVTHAVNPNFLQVYLENHAPRLNVGVSIEADPNGNTTTDAVSASIFQRVAQKCGSKLQVFQIRNDTRSGGTVGPMLSSKTGIRALDAGIPQLSMHSIRATTGSLDPGLGVKVFAGFYDYFEEVDQEFA
ncbi:aspartyl aminopeptidase [Xylona heveae TC161]|uniref:Aspartyl aminopeptidase n=1 Tax=Xylona heveae (strain CBS 132557 / TC161) TaxID=1328760 RepID=A0A165AFF3_XYLHT|nr:aspartyl aminopeptidase [Xylona heveae TC161]KZF20388.1 aspartyl aminopeptidase [Xylona heveae TC161]